jgi:transposase
MQLLKYGIGIDMSMQKFDVCVSVIDAEQRVLIKATHSFENTVKGFVAFLKWSDKYCREKIPQVFLMEATGVYYEQLAWYLYQKDKQISIILPNKAKRYKESLGLKSKNDSIDAKGLSKMACEQHLKAWQPLSKSIYSMRLITRQIERISYLITQLNNQLHALQHGMYRDKTIEQMIEKSIASFKKQKAKLENRIENIIADDAVLKERFEQICRIKGLGIQTLAVIIAETDGFALMENQSQLVSYVGYDVVENQSGTRAGKTRISKKGNSHIRRALHMPALNMVRYKQTPFTALYERIYEKSKIKMKGYTAIQKKLLIIIYTLWKKKEAYNPNYLKISSVVELEPSFGYS